MTLLEADCGAEAVIGEADAIDALLGLVNKSLVVTQVALSVMLTCQLPRAFEIARRYRERGVPVIFGGIATMLHAEEVAGHADAVFLGEAEGKIEQVIRDFVYLDMERVRSLAARRRRMASSANGSKRPASGSDQYRAEPGRNARPAP